MPELISKPEEIRLNEQQEIQQIMGEPPRWITRWGISLVFMAVFVLFTIAYLIKYPDIIAAPITLQTENPPIRIPAPVTGKIEKLLVKDAQIISEGELLAIFENTADLESVALLEAFIEKIAKEKSAAELPLPENLQLGTLQKGFSLFAENYKDYHFFLKKDKTTIRAKYLNNQVAKNKELGDVLEGREKSLKKDISIAKEALSRYQTLFAQGLMSRQEYEQELLNIGEKEREIESLQTEFIKINITIQQLEQQIVELGEIKDKASYQKKVATQESVEQLRSQLEDWKLSFLLKSPIRGVVSFSKPLSENQFLQAGEEMMTVVPEGKNTGEIKGLATLPFDGAGKVTIGQRVNIRLNDFPYQEFGSINATVRSIALVPQKQSYLVEIEMPHTLLTTYNKELPFRQQMTGTGHIVTEERRYLERILDKVVSAWRNR